MSLVGRPEERQVLEGLLDGAAGGLSGVLVLRGPAGVGKTALLDDTVVGAASRGFRVVRVVGVEAEQELGFAGLHRLVTDLLAQRASVPPPQREALEAAFGLGSNGRADRFLIGLAVLALLGGAAVTQPVLWVCDDAQWLDRETVSVLAFLGRRLEVDRVVLLLGLREGEVGEDFEAGSNVAPETLDPDDVARHLDGLAALPVHGLPSDAARALVAACAPGGIDPDDVRRIVAEARGNPLAIRELTTELIGSPTGARSPLASRLPLGRRLESAFLARVRDLPEPTPLLLLVVAAESTGDPDILWRAASWLEIDGGRGTLAEALEPARRGDLVLLTPVVGFRHPLIRSAVYESASPSARARVHAALAAAMEIASASDAVADRRVWHLAAASTGPDDRVADELEQRARRAQDRAGFTAQSAFLLRAAELTSDRSRAAERLWQAAVAAVSAGLLRRARELLDRIPADVDDEMRARVVLTRGAVEVTLGRFDLGVRLMLDGARTLLDLGVADAREIAAYALQTVVMVPWLEEHSRESVVALARELLAARTAGPDSTTGHLLTAHGTRIVEGSAGATVEMRAAAQGLLHHLEPDHCVRWIPFVTIVTGELWDLEAMVGISEGAARQSRALGGFEALRYALHAQAHIATWCGEFARAAALHDEFVEVSTTLGHEARANDVMLAAYRGDRAATRRALDRVPAPAGLLARGGIQVQIARTALTILENASGRYTAALEAGRPVWNDDSPYWSHFVLPELVEAGARGGDRDLAVAAAGRLDQRATAAGTPWALGLLARSRALLADDTGAEALHLEALEHLDISGVRVEYARAHLLYGEWLRRRRRRAEARRQLGRAHDLFSEMGAHAFAERASRELTAAGATVRHRTARDADELTPHELRIARLAADGATNPQIAIELFISPNTVEYHLRKIFRKLGIGSRRQLTAALLRES